MVAFSNVRGWWRNTIRRWPLYLEHSATVTAFYPVTLCVCAFICLLNASVSHTQFSYSSLQYFLASCSQTTFRMCSHIHILPTCRVSYSSSLQEAMNIKCHCAFAFSFIVPHVNGQYRKNSENCIAIWRHSTKNASSECLGKLRRGNSE
jgi:hypothetical protein